MSPLRIFAEQNSSRFTIQTYHPSTTLILVLLLTTAVLHRSQLRCRRIIGRLHNVGKVNHVSDSVGKGSNNFSVRHEIIQLNAIIKFLTSHLINVTALSSAKKTDMWKKEQILKQTCYSFPAYSLHQKEQLVFIPRTPFLLWSLAIVQGTAPSTW